MYISDIEYEYYIQEWDTIVSDSYEEYKYKW